MTHINWNLPPLRSGILGLIDKAAGPGATKVEYALQTLFPLGAAYLAYSYAAVTFPEWGWWKVTLYALLAFDMLGGIITNSTSSAKRWYHREGQRTIQHLRFVALHIFQISVVAIVFRDFDYFYLATVSAFMMGASAIILFTPIYLQRATALILFAVGIILNFYAWPPVTGIEWFTLALLLKLLVAHLPHEEPYRPKLEDNVSSKFSN